MSECLEYFHAVSGHKNIRGFFLQCFSKAIKHHLDYRIEVMQISFTGLQNIELMYYLR